MTILDIVLLLCFVPAIVKGVTKGFIRQAVELIAVLVGAWLAMRFSSLIGSWLGQYFEMEPTVLSIISFILIVILVALLLSLAAALVTKLLNLIALGWINRLLGFVFAILKVAVILGLAILAFESLNASFGLVKDEVLDSSVVYTKIREIAEHTFPFMKNLIASINA